jgi:CelD/BcsL family acetyltransferase involved in cellulose biosynthesis
LRLLLLCVDGAPIAAWYGWMIGGRYAYYQAGFDPAWSRSSPGLVLLAETVRIATEEGAREYDLLRGDEDFKFRFAAGTRTGRSLSMAVPGHPAALRASAANLARLAWHRLPERSRMRLRGGNAAQVDDAA